MAEHAEVLVKARNVDELSEAEKLAVEELIDMWHARAFFESQSARRIDDGDWSGQSDRLILFIFPIARPVADGSLAPVRCDFGQGCFGDGKRRHI